MFLELSERGKCLNINATYRHTVTKPNTWCRKIKAFENSKLVYHDFVCFFH